mmetsp:Transcript_54139/g.115031  ORF Transcript_54139/g.115031 Transcript_54139/m.115031 type:complete len:484 (-) Transcript_54139:207-1658(-)
MPPVSSADQKEPTKRRREDLEPVNYETELKEQEQQAERLQQEIEALEEQTRNKKEELQLLEGQIERTRQNIAVLAAYKDANKVRKRAPRTTNLNNLPKRIDHPTRGYVYQCTAEGCTHEAKGGGGGLCTLHGGAKFAKLCKVPGCTTRAHRKGRCNMHTNALTPKICSREGCNTVIPRKLMLCPVHKKGSHELDLATDHLEDGRLWNKPIKVTRGMKNQCSRYEKEVDPELQALIEKSAARARQSMDKARKIVAEDEMMRGEEEDRNFERARREDEEGSFERAQKRAQLTAHAVAEQTEQKEEEARLHSQRVEKDAYCQRQPSLVLPSDEAATTEFMFLLLSQYRPTVLKDTDRQVEKHYNLPNGHAGMACQHCFPGPNGRFFHPALRGKTGLGGNATVDELYGHVLHCPMMPDKTIEELKSKRMTHELELGEGGSNKAIFKKVWMLLHGRLEVKSKKTRKSNRKEADLRRASKKATKAKQEK